MQPLLRALPLLFLLPLTFGCANVADRVARGVERGAERAAERESSRRADRAVTGMIQGMENAIVCLATDPECIESAQAEGRPVEVRDRDGNVVEQIPAPTSVNANNAFAAGDSLLFSDDYGGTQLGDFPARLEFVNGNWELVEWNGRRLLRTTGPRDAAFRVFLADALPDTFMVETELYFAHTHHRMVVLTQPPQRWWSDVDYNFFQFVSSGNGGTGIHANSGSGLPTSRNKAEQLVKGLTPIRLLVEGESVKVFVGDDRVASMPNAYLPRSEALQFHVATGSVTENQPMYIGPIRVTTHKKG